MAGPRRDLLTLLLVLGGGYAVLRGAASAYARLSAPEAETIPLDRPAGFRLRVAGATSTGGFDPFVGIAPAGTSAPNAGDVETRLCAALFGGPPPSGVVPIAAFSDYACPYCRVLTRRLSAYATDAPGVQVTWHEAPILGDASRAAARAALAARRQGAYADFHARLVDSPFQPTDGYLRDVAADLGLDADRLLADARGAAVAGEMADSLALLRLFGTVGVPVVVIGRTVVQGALTMDDVARIAARERDPGPVPGCA